MPVLLSPPDGMIRSGFTQEDVNGFLNVVLDTYALNYPQSMQRKNTSVKHEFVNRRIQSGKHGHYATFEHIRATRKGEPCYCGQIGCWDTLCSMPTLLGDEEPEDFFEQMRAGDKARRKSWRTFLKHLARLIKDLHLVNDIDIMLGGRLAPFMIPEDIDLLYKKIREICPFEEEDDFILLSKMPAYHIPTGAALHYIHKFLENV